MTKVALGLTGAAGGFMAAAYAPEMVGAIMGAVAVLGGRLEYELRKLRERMDKIEGTIK